MPAFQPYHCGHCLSSTHPKGRANDQEIAQTCLILLNTQAPSPPFCMPMASKQATQDTKWALTNGLSPFALLAVLPCLLFLLLFTRSRPPYTTTTTTAPGSSSISSSLPHSFRPFFMPSTGKQVVREGGEVERLSRMNASILTHMPACPSLLNSIPPPPLLSRPPAAARARHAQPPDRCLPSISPP